MLSLLATCHHGYTIRAPRSRLPTLRMAAAGADLEGGQNEERNAALSALKRSFLASADDRPTAYDDATRLGLYLDVPVCRWGFNILPHHRTTLNVFQAQYTLAFEKLLATPQPWLYAHILLPGGVDNLADPEFALAAPDSKAPAHGTLMQIVAVQREADSRLTLLVQGLARVEVWGWC